VAEGGVARIEPDAVVTSDGTHLPCDTIIWESTGFTTTEFLAPIAFIGRDGQELHVAWRQGAEGQPRHQRHRFPEPLVDVRAQHQPRAQLDRLSTTRCSGGCATRCGPPDAAAGT
jgi:putative intracellular protease/amidase